MDCATSVADTAKATAAGVAAAMEKGLAQVDAWCTHLHLWWGKFKLFMEVMRQLALSVEGQPMQDQEYTVTYAALHAWSSMIARSRFDRGHAYHAACWCSRYFTF